MRTALLLFVACAALQAEFSHRIHLAQKIDCLVCHSSAASSVKASDNLIPSAQVCSTCHTGARALKTPPVIKQPRTNLVTKFPHQIHVRLGRMIGPLLVRKIDSKGYLSDPGDLKAQLTSQPPHSCTGCHRGLTTSDAVSAANFPHMADCLVCHTKAEPPFSCTTCHDESARLKPASHAEGFVDQHSSPKIDKASCAVCHGRRFTCMGCHQ